MTDTTFYNEAVKFAAEMEEFIAINEDDDSVDEKFMEFSKDLSARMIAASKKSDFDLGDVIDTIRYMEQIEDFHGNVFAGDIDTDLPQATEEILTPVRVFSHMEQISGKHPSRNYLVLNGVRINLEQAQMFYDALAGLNADIAFSYLNHGKVQVENNYFEELEINPLEMPEREPFKEPLIQLTEKREPRFGPINVMLRMTNELIGQIKEYIEENSQQPNFHDDIYDRFGTDIEGKFSFISNNYARIDPKTRVIGILKEFWSLGNLDNMNTEPLSFVDILCPQVVIQLIQDIPNEDYIAFENETGTEFYKLHEHEADDAVHREYPFDVLTGRSLKK